MMEAKDVLNLPWKKVEDWSQLSTSKRRPVLKKDIRIFVDNIYHDISRKLHIPYENLKPILVSENKSFYQLLDFFFEDDDSRCWYHTEKYILSDLANALKVPDVNSNKVNTCVELFEKLSDMEKIQFFQKIGKISVTVQTVD